MTRPVNKLLILRNRLRRRKGVSCTRWGNLGGVGHAKGSPGQWLPHPQPPGLERKGVAIKSTGHTKYLYMMAQPVGIFIDMHVVKMKKATESEIARPLGVIYPMMTPRSYIELNDPVQCHNIYDWDWAFINSYIVESWFHGRYHGWNTILWITLMVTTPRWYIIT